MMYQLTMQDVTYRDYPIQYFSSPSTGIEDIDIIDILDSMLSNWVRERPKTPFYHSLISLLKTDLSSIWPHFEIKSETSMFEEIFEREIPKDMLEFDIIVRMPPMKERSARLRVKSVEKATPRIVEPVGL
ncbi:MAG: hypothetical protein ACTSR2_02890 [Candidatus Hodarchaeales archaeon]